MVSFVVEQKKSFFFLSRLAKKKKNITHIHFHTEKKGEELGKEKKSLLLFRQ